MGCSDSAKFSVEDAKTMVKLNIHKRWKEKWLDEPIKIIRKIKNNTIKFNIPRTMKKEEATKILRLRLGHTKLTHEHLCKNVNQTNCQNCNCQLSVEHILIDCSKFNKERHKHKIKNIQILNNPRHYNNIIITRYENSKLKICIRKPALMTTEVDMPLNHNK